jgi:sulfofructose kinase
VADLEDDSDPQFHQLLALADHLILSRDFARALTGARSPAQAVRKLARPDRQVAVVTCGEEGCWYLAQGEAVPRRQPAFKVKAVDTTGCGDVFHGAYAFALARGMVLEERIRFAAGTAALKATRPGGQAGIPSLPAVRRFLNNECISQSR